MKILNFLFALFICSAYPLSATDSMHASLLPSTESDPDAFIHHCCNAINGDYCESIIDLMVTGPDALLLQRYYNNKNYLTGDGVGGWRIFPQAFLVLGKDPQSKECKVRGERFEWVYAYTGERSGGILTYSGWKRVDGDTKDPLKLNPLSDCIGMVNTYAAEMNGQTNHLNNRIDCKGNTCELTLGDGTKRLYEKIQSVPSMLLGEELLPTMASKVGAPQYYRLVSEALPSGNIIYISYNEDGHLASVEICNASGNNVHSWLRFTYQFHPKGCRLEITSSDEKTLTYELEKTQTNGKTHFALKSVQGSHSLPISYNYKTSGNHYLLTQKILPEGRFLEIDYDGQARVKALKSPGAQSGKSTLLYGFSYEDTFTDVVNAENIKTRYRYDDRLQLIAVERYDQKGKLYRTDQKYYGQTKNDATLLTARTVADGHGHVLSYRSFKYDSNGNVLEERLYGNLTGKKDISLQVDAKGKLLNPDEEECHVKKFTYSEDGFNLLTSLGDSKGNRTTYHYEDKSNRLCRKLIYEGSSIRKREYRFYNDDAACTKIVEDNGSEETLDHRYAYPKERHITEFHPKQQLPGVGLPEIIEESALDVSTKKQIPIKKLINTYSLQGDLLSCATYDADGNYAYTVSKTYNHLGQVTSETDPEGKTVSYSYDIIGNQILVSIPHKQKTVETKYDFRNNPVQIIETAGHLRAIQKYSYDALDRKITSTDRFGNTTQYEYDDFGHLTKLIHPTVLDEYAQPIQPTFSYTYDIFGNVLTTIDPKGYTIQKVYNLRGDPSKIYYPDGSFELFKYDAEGSLHRSLTRDRIITVYEYDYLGRVVHEELSIAGEKGVESYFKTRRYSYTAFHPYYEKDDNAITDLKYDPTGRVVEILKYKDGYKSTESEPRKTEIIYDSLGRESKKKIWFDTGETDYSLECVEYDLLGNVVQKRIEDADGNILLLKNFAYDDAGRCIEENTEQTLLKTTYDPFGEPILYLDALGNETKVIVDYGKDLLTKTIVNPLGVQTFIHFDALGRIISTVKKDSKNVLLSSEEIFYDALGNKSAAAHAVIVDGKQIGTQKTRWVYGPMSRLEQLIEAEGSPEEKITTYTYDDLGRLENKHLPGAENPLHYTYNKQGLVSKLEYVEGKKTLLSHIFSYDKKGNITSALECPPFKQDHLSCS
jgi:YD repeat-containing protein